MQELSDGDIALLSYIEQNPGCDSADLDRAFTVSVQARLSALLGKHLVDDLRMSALQGDKSKQLGLYRVSASGAAALEDRASGEKREKRSWAHDWKVQIAAAITGAIAGLVTSFIFWILTK